MFGLLFSVVAAFASAFKSRRTLTLESLALHQLVTMLRRSVKRPRVAVSDRVFWIAFAHCVEDWRNKLYALHPDTLVRWHKAGFRRYWTWKSRRIGRPAIEFELRKLIRDMQVGNMTSGAPRIHGDLLKLGYDLSEATVSKYMKRHRRPPSQSWRTFLSNHAEVIVAIDFFTVPTATFRILYAFIVIEHKCRRIVHFNVTSHPTAQQIVDAFSFDTMPRYLLSDNDGVYGAVFQRRLAKEYLGYYHHSRNHLSLNKDSPMPRPIQSRMDGIIVAFPVLGGLHHRYVRTAA